MSSGRGITVSKRLLPFDLQWKYVLWQSKHHSHLCGCPLQRIVTMFMQIRLRILGSVCNENGEEQSESMGIISYPLPLLDHETHK